MTTKLCTKMKDRYAIHYSGFGLQPAPKMLALDWVFLAIFIIAAVGMAIGEAIKAGLV